MAGPPLWICHWYKSYAGQRALISILIVKSYTDYYSPNETHGVVAGPPTPLISGYVAMMFLCWTDGTDLHNFLFRYANHCRQWIYLS